MVEGRCKCWRDFQCFIVDGMDSNKKCVKIISLPHPVDVKNAMFAVRVWGIGKRGILHLLAVLQWGMLINGTTVVYLMYHSGALKLKNVTRM